MSLCRFAGGPDDPLLRADRSKDDKRARQALKDDATTEVGEDTPTKSPKGEDCSEHAEGEEEEKNTRPSKGEDVDNQEKARAKEVRSECFRVFGPTIY